jgi:transposase
MVIDVACSKYCDLIPIERQAAIAGREGIKELPAQSLIDGTHQLADYVKGAYDLVKEEIKQAKVLHADETPHRMLEGDKKNNWFLWGFSTSKAALFECRDTRSGDVAFKLLKNAKCEYLVSDVFSGYIKATRETNEYRASQNLPLIATLYCNAHARRKFHEAKDSFREDSDYYLGCYQKIYLLEKESKGKPPDEVAHYRKRMETHFEEMKSRALETLLNYSSKSSIVRAMSYFLENYEGLIRFLEDPELPIDNNPQERLLRNPVIGRKTWYGTHSERGAETAEVLFTLVESCKLNKLNPRSYLKKLVETIHLGGAPFSPAQFATH